MEPFHMWADVPTSLGSGLRYSGWRGPVKQQCSWHYLLSLSGLRVSPVSWLALPSFAAGDEVIVAREKPRQNIRGRRCNALTIQTELKMSGCAPLCRPALIEYTVNDPWECTTAFLFLHRGGLWPPHGRWSPRWPFWMEMRLADCQFKAHAVAPLNQHAALWRQNTNNTRSSDQKKTLSAAPPIPLNPSLLFRSYKAYCSIWGG